MPGGSGFRRAPITKRRAAFSAASQRRTALSNLCSVKDDKPLYIQGPSDSPARVERILRALEARCGEDGYHYIVAGDNFEPFDGEEQNGESAVTDPVRRKGLDRMAAGLRASRPGMQVRINPPGHRKVSDMIWLVANRYWSPHRITNRRK